MNSVLVSIGLSFLRQALMAAGAAVVAKGYLDADTIQQAIGAILALVSSFLSVSAAKSGAEAKEVVKKTLGANDTHRVL